MMGNRSQHTGRQPASSLRMTLPGPRRTCWTRLAAIVLLFASADPVKTAGASVHSLGDITSAIPVTWSDDGSIVGGLEQPEERVLFRLARGQHLVLSLDPMPDGRSPGVAVNMQASVWNKDGKLMGTLEGQPLRLAGYLGAGDYQLRVRPIGGGANSPYRLSIKPAEAAPRPKAWALVGLAAVVIALRMLSGSRTYSVMGPGGAQYRDIS